MSATPRTDDQVSRYYDDATGTRIEYVPARFARQLERELDGSQEENKKLRQELAEYKSNQDKADVVSALGSGFPDVLRGVIDALSKPQP